MNGGGPKVRNVLGSLVIPWLLLFVVASWMQASLGQTQPLVVGITELPPYSTKTDDGRWEGLGIELWRRAAEEMGVVFELKEYARIKQIAQALTQGEIDLTCMLPLSEHNETILDLSHTYHRTGLDIVVGSTSRGLQWFDYVRHISYGNIIAVISLFIFISLIAGSVIWLLEKKANPDMFGKRVASGIGHGLWWALVTMTTVGYGDKAPKTVGGRVIAVAWMFMSVSFIAGYTAVITSSMTVGELSGRIRDARDLPYVQVGALSRSETLDLLASKGILAIPFDDLQVGLQAVADKDIDAFVDNEAQLTYLVKNHFPGRLLLIGETFEHFYVSMGLPEGSPLREPLNRAIAKLLAQEDWDRLKLAYMGRIQ